MTEQTRHRPPQHAPAPTPAEYEAPRAPTTTVDPRFHDVGEVIVRWEKLRLVFNLLLAVWTFLLTALRLFSPWLSMRFIDDVILGALIANICFCAGPIVDSYITWFVRKNPLVTPVLFVLGTGFSLLLAMVAVLTA